MVKERDITYWNVAVPKPLNEALETAISRNMHMTKADFIRDAVRRELERTGHIHNSKETLKHEQIGRQKAKTL